MKRLITALLFLALSACGGSRPDHDDELLANSNAFIDQIKKDHPSYLACPKPNNDGREHALCGTPTYLFEFTPYAIVFNDYADMAGFSYDEPYMPPSDGASFSGSMNQGGDSATATFSGGSNSPFYGVAVYVDVYNIIHVNPSIGTPTTYILPQLYDAARNRYVLPIKHPMYP